MVAVGGGTSVAVGGGGFVAVGGGGLVAVAGGGSVLVGGTGVVAIVVGRGVAVGTLVSVGTTDVFVGPCVAVGGTLVAVPVGFGFGWLVSVGCPTTTGGLVLVGRTACGAGVDVLIGVIVGI